MSIVQLVAIGMGVILLWPTISTYVMPYISQLFNKTSTSTMKSTLPDIINIVKNQVAQGQVAQNKASTWVELMTAYATLRDLAEKDGCTEAVTLLDQALLKMNYSNIKTK